MLFVGTVDLRDLLGEPRLHRLEGLPTALDLLHVEPQARGVLCPDDVDRREERTSVRLHHLDRRTFLRRREVVGEQAPGQLGRIALDELGDVPRQVRDDEPVVVLRMHRHGDHGRGAEALVGVAVGDVYAQVPAQGHQQRPGRVAESLPQRVVPELRLGLADEPREAHGRVDVGQRIVGVAVVDAVGGTEAFQGEGHHALLLRPVDAIRTQGAGRPDQVDEIPARVALLPLAGVGVHQVPIQGVAQKLIVETQVVVADDAGPGHSQRRIDLPDRLPFIDALGIDTLRRDARDQARLGARQYLPPETDIGHVGLVDHLEIRVGPAARELHDAVAARMGTRGLQVVPVETRRGRCPPCARHASPSIARVIPCADHVTGFRPRQQFGSPGQRATGDDAALGRNRLS